jgi:O-antigen/teichoic acid export membrane protein
VILLARWMGSSEYGLYSFAIACTTLLAYVATLGLHGAAVRFVAQYAAADDWQHVAGFMKMSSWLAFGCGALVAILAIGGGRSSGRSSIRPMSHRPSSRCRAFQSSL